MLKTKIEYENECFMVYDKIVREKDQAVLMGIRAIYLLRRYGAQNNYAKAIIMRLCNRINNYENVCCTELYVKSPNDTVFFEIVDRLRFMAESQEKFTNHIILALLKENAVTA